MIRPLRPDEAGEAAALWLAAYWQGHFDEVRVLRRGVDRDTGEGERTMRWEIE